MHALSHVLIIAFPLALLVGTGSPLVAQDQPAVAEKPTPQPELTKEQIEQLVKDLGAEKFSDRENAMKDLREAGPAAISPLAEAARSGDLEVTLRAIRVLESLLTTGSLEEFEAAETALEGLKETGGKSVAPRAETVLASMGEVREKRAIAAITRLEGSVKSDVRQFGFAPNGPAGGGDLISTVVLNRRWKGGEEGLKYLENLRFLRTVYLVEGVLPAPAIARLEQKLGPNTKVMLRGGACLGVGGLGVEGGCEIQLINPGSAADKAGLRPGDLIVAFNGKPSPDEREPLDFDRLVELIKEHDAGDKIPIRIRRNGREQVVEVVLDEWK
jgi:hypothetical protein